MARPIVLCVCVAWATTKTDKNKLAKFERKALMWIFGLKRNALGVLELRINQEIEESHGETNIIGVLKSSRLWTRGHGLDMRGGRRAQPSGPQDGHRTQKYQEKGPGSV